MVQQDIDAAFIACNVSLIYTHGRVVSGCLHLPLNAPTRLFLECPNGIEGEHIHSIRKPEQTSELLKEYGLPLSTKLVLEGDELPFTGYNRLTTCFPEIGVVPCDTVLIRQAWSIKTLTEIELFRHSRATYTKVYEQIPSVCQPGMTDRQLSIEIEWLMRLEGCLGIFHASGQSMEIFTGDLLVGDNVAVPSPCDFALGGEGPDPSLSDRVSGTFLKVGQCFIMDMGGNFCGYTGDMSCVFSIGKLSEQVYAAHQTCMEVREEVTAMVKPGIACEDMHNKAIDMVTKAGFADYFMGISQKAKFIGHGIELEINEMPVLVPRTERELEPGMAFALEPRIISPDIGPVGIENSWVVTTEGLEELTLCGEGTVEL